MCNPHSYMGKADLYNRIGFSKNSLVIVFVIALCTVNKSIIALILVRVSLTRMKKYQLSLLLAQAWVVFSIIALEYPEGPRKNREWNS